MQTYLCVFLDSEIKTYKMWSLFADTLYIKQNSKLSNTNSGFCLSATRISIPLGWAMHHWVIPAWCFHNVLWSHLQILTEVLRPMHCFKTLGSNHPCYSTTFQNYKEPSTHVTQKATQTRMEYNLCNIKILLQNSVLWCHSWTQSLFSKIL